MVSVGAVIVDRGRVLLVQRGRPPLEGRWSVPGGVVEVGESLAAAAAREAREETGLAIDVGPLLDVCERVQRASDGRVEYHYVIVEYLCSVLSDTEPVAGSDAADARWAAAASLDGYDLTPQTRAVIHKALELMARNP